MSAAAVAGPALREALVAGIQRVLARRDEINRINVFPIADHDAGTNLAATLGAVLQALRDPALAAAPGGAVLRRAADEANDAARGNSGVLFANFFQGAAEGLSAGATLTVADLASAFARGTASARQAVAEPRAGTMLCVMQAFADGAAAPGAAGEPRRGFAAALAQARTALEGTREKLPQLRKAGVVDAGALGFFSLLEGIAGYLEHGPDSAAAGAPAELLEPGVITARDEAGPYAQRVQCLLTADRVDRAGLQAALLALPLSQLVLTGTRTQLRVHACTDDPAVVLAAVRRFGTVSHEQIAPAGEVSARPAIVTDTGADLPPGEVARLGLHLVPQRLSVDGQDRVDRVSLTAEEFYGAMRANATPRTSQPPPGDFRRMFAHLLRFHREVVDVSLARTLSGTLQGAERAAARVDAKRVRVVDTFSGAPGQGLLAIWAGEAAQAGLDAAAIAAGIERLRGRTMVHAVVRDIRYAVRGGRVPKIAETLTKLLGISLTLATKPNGKLGMKGALRGGADLPERFARSLARRLRPGGRHRVMIGHCDCAAEAERAAAAFRASGRTIDKLWVVECGVAVGAHAGPGSLIIGVQDYEEPRR